MVFAKQTFVASAAIVVLQVSATAVSLQEATQLLEGYVDSFESFHLRYERTRVATRGVSVEGMGAAETKEGKSTAFSDTRSYSMEWWHSADRERVDLLDNGLVRVCKVLMGDQTWRHSFDPQPDGSVRLNRSLRFGNGDRGSVVDDCGPGGLFSNALRWRDHSSLLESAEDTAVDMDEDGVLRLRIWYNSGGGEKLFEICADRSRGFAITEFSDGATEESGDRPRVRMTWEAVEFEEMAGVHVPTEIVRQQTHYSPDRGEFVPVISHTTTVVWVSLNVALAEELFTNPHGITSE